MSKTMLKDGYKSVLSTYETQVAIGIIKRSFEDNLKNSLNLIRVSAPLFVDASTGLNDDLNGVERPVSFDILETKTTATVVHSLAKWKRMALYKYGFKPFTGLYTDMNAIRRDEEMDNLHSIYVDQWDWEMIIDKESRNIDFLKSIVEKIVNAICDTADMIKEKYDLPMVNLSREISFVTTTELLKMYPSLSPKERENEFVKEHKTVFVMQIGDVLEDGQKHDGRAPDYDDWSLNGDILFYNEVLDSAYEVSSMGIRVDKTALSEQLTKACCTERSKMQFHKMILDEVLPLTLGGGIGQSRICMLLLQKLHIGEVQASIWDTDTLSKCKDAGIELL